MKTRVIAIAAVLVALSATRPAHAGTPTVDSQEFATNLAFCGGGAFTLTGKLKVVGGSANFGSCHVTMSDGSKLSFEDVDLGSNAGDFVITGGEKSRVSFTDSYITAFNGFAPAVLSIGPGLDPSGGDGGAVKVDDTHLLAGSVILQPSCDHNRGKVTVKGNSLEGVGGGDITIRTSVCGADQEGGKVSVSDASLTTGSISLVTGSTGSISIVRNNLSASSIQISGGKCKTKDNQLAGNPYDFPCT